MAEGRFDRKSGLAFVVAFGVVSLFADAAYEGMRGISGPFLATLGASGTAVGIIAGAGELAGYLLRLFSGALAQKTRAYWTITLFGYVIQMAAVPLLALAGSWWMAALLIVIERAGKAMRNPPRDVMLARAGDQIGHGWAFGLHDGRDSRAIDRSPRLVAAPRLSRGVRLARRSGGAHLVQPVHRAHPVWVRWSRQRGTENRTRRQLVARVLALCGRDRSGRFRLRGFSIDRLPLREGRYRSGKLHSPLLRGSDGRRRFGFAAVRALVRRTRTFGPDPGHAAWDSCGPVRFPRRFLDGTGRRASLGSVARRA